MKTNPAQTYRVLSAQSSNPVGIVVQAYDQILMAIYAAIRAIEQRDIETKTAELNRALALMAHLQGALDFERGGKVAKNLETFYIVQRGQILAASAQLSTELLRSVAEAFRSMREAWEEVERSVSVAVASTRPSPSPSVEPAGWQA